MGKIIMKFKSLAISALIAAGFVATSIANAASYSFSYLANDNSYQVNGILTTADILNAVSGYDILGISGSVTGAGGGTIASLVNNPAQPYPTNNGSYLYDNNLFPSASPQLNNNGVLFTTSGGTVWNLYSISPTTYELHSYIGVQKAGTFQLAPVPEPETYAMLLAGLGLMATIARRRKQA